MRPIKGGGRGIVVIIGVGMLFWSKWEGRCCKKFSGCFGVRV